jgi:hypothetical protein
MYVLAARVVGGDSRYCLDVVHRPELVEWVVGQGDERAEILNRLQGRTF